MIFSGSDLSEKIIVFSCFLLFSFGHDILYNIYWLGKYGVLWSFHPIFAHLSLQFICDIAAQPVFECISTPRKLDRVHGTNLYSCTV